MNRPAPLKDARRRWNGVWAVFAILASVLICGAVATLYFAQNRALDDSAGIIRDFRQARIDLYQGYLHVALGTSVDSPWERHQGLALLKQALMEFHNALASLPAKHEAGQAFAAQLRAFEEIVRRASGTSQNARNDVELRAAFHRLDHMAVEIDAEVREYLTVIRAEQEELFRIILAAAAALLALISASVIWTGRREAAAEAARAKAMHQAAVGFERFEKFFNTSPIATSVLTLEDGRFVAVNDASCELYGYRREELVGHTADEIGIWADQAQRDGFLRRLRSVTSLRIASRLGLSKNSIRSALSKPSRTSPERSLNLISQSVTRLCERNFLRNPSRCA